MKRIRFHVELFLDFDADRREIGQGEIYLRIHFDRQIDITVRTVVATRL